jgi:hypothetical protein
MRSELAEKFAKLKTYTGFLITEGAEIERGSGDFLVSRE